MGHHTKKTKAEPFNTQLADAMQRAFGQIEAGEVEAQGEVEKPAKGRKVSDAKSTEAAKLEVDERLAALGAKKPVKAGRPHSVIHLAKPPIDKIAAHALLERANGDKELQIAGYQASTECGGGQMLGWIGSGIWPIDIGQEKYHQTNFPSSFAQTLNFLGRTPTKGETELARLLEQNNRTGNLKNGEYAIPRLLREFYELPGVHISGVEQKWLPTWDEVIDRAMDVVKAFLEVHDREEALPNFVSLEKHFPGISNTGMHGPLSIGDYLRNLFVLGIEKDELIRRWNWWMEHRLWVDTVKQNADKVYTKSKFDRLDIGNNLRVMIIESDDSWLVRAAGKGERGQSAKRRAHVSIVRTSGGLVSVMKIHFGLDISDFANAVIQREPGLWYHQKAQGVLMNGSVQYQQDRPTKLSVEDLVELLRQHPPTFRQRKSH